MASPPLHYKFIEAGNANISYIEAGNPDLPTILLLHGFPASASQYNTLIPLLADTYHVLAPTFPGFGSTVAAADYTYTFSSLASTLSAFLVALHVGSYAAYAFDYGAPVLWRVALDQPAGTSIAAIVSQNGNAYVDGLGQEFWAPVERYWLSGSDADRQAVAADVLTPKATEAQYRTGVPEYKQNLIDPSLYALDYLQNLAPSSNRSDIQLDLLYDYRNNVEMYPAFQQWFRETQIPLVAVWGKGDIAFVPAGAEAFKSDLPNAKVKFLNTGHFAVATDSEVLARDVKVFLTSINF